MYLSMKGEEMLSMVISTKLRQIRESLGVSQDALVRKCRSIPVRTYVRIEQGKSAARYDTAMQILDAINALLAEQGKPEMSLEALDLKLY
jgi:transcriptional regulator with XRE-family HTH domain